MSLSTTWRVVKWDLEKISIFSAVLFFGLWFLFNILNPLFYFLDFVFFFNILNPLFSFSEFFFFLIFFIQVIIN